MTASGLQSDATTNTMIQPRQFRYLLCCSAVLTLLLPAVGSLQAQEAGEYGHYTVYDPDLLPRAEYERRRTAVLERLQPEEAMLVTAAEPRVRSNDVDYEFRQRNSLLYLAGITEPGAALLLTATPIEIDGVMTNQVLFVPDRNRFTETWTGILVGPQQAPSVYGVRAAVSRSRLHETVRRARPRTLYYDGWGAGERLVDVLTGDTVRATTAFSERARQLLPTTEIRNASEILDGLRLVKSSAEVELLRRAVQITVEAHRETIRAARVGMHEYELEAIMEMHFHRRGAESPGYTSIVGSGPNSCILHYSTNRRRTEAGDLVLMDCGAELHGYSADLTRTIPISGRFTEEQRAIYELVLRAHAAAIDQCRSGNSFWAPHMTAARIIADGLIRLGILRDAKQVHRYFPHGTSHYLGLDVHDVGPHSLLEPGMVLTVEPGIYIPAGSDCDERWWNIGVRIEDDILVTEADPENLSRDLERTVEEIESLMNE